MNTEHTSQFYFANTLTNNTIQKIDLFYKTLHYCSIEQYPDWAKTVYHVTTTYYVSENKNAIECFAVIGETGTVIKNATIQFGPLIHTIQELPFHIARIVEYCKKKLYKNLAIQLCFPISTETEIVQLLLLKQHPSFKLIFSEENWTSLRILLKGKTLQQIENDFSKGHRSAIKKSEKDGLQVKHLIKQEELLDMYTIYKKMNDSRERKNDLSEKDFICMCNTILKNELGFILGVFLPNNTMLGWMIALHQGNLCRYYKGASHPEYRNYNILHVAIKHGIELALKNNKEYFDLWGYNHFVDESDQRYFINKFKKGFGGEYVCYPSKYLIKLNLPIISFFHH